MKKEFAGRVNELLAIINDLEKNKEELEENVALNYISFDRKGRCPIQVRRLSEHHVEKITNATIAAIDECLAESNAELETL